MASKKWALLFLGIFITILNWPSYGSSFLHFNPVSTDTLKIWFEPNNLLKFSYDFYVSNQFRRFDVFTKNEPLASDSVVWELDEKNLTEWCVDSLCFPFFDAGKESYAVKLGPWSIRMVGPGAHELKARAYLNDTLYESTWKLFFYETYYTQAEVLVRVDSGSGYTLLQAKPMDAVLFDGIPGSLFDSTMKGRFIPKSQVFQGYQIQPPTPDAGMDTMRIFIQCIRNDSGLVQYFFSNKKSVFFNQSGQPPFSFATAYLLMSTYAKPMRLGPLFMSTPSFRTVRGHFDSRYWYVYESGGYGDCMAGCTSSYSTSYRIAALGDESGVCETPTPLFPGMGYREYCHGIFPVVSIARPLGPNRETGLTWKSGNTSIDVMGRNRKQNSKIHIPFNTLNNRY